MPCSEIVPVLQVGVSGAGKTTLMDVLAGRKTSAAPLSAPPAVNP